MNKETKYQIASKPGAGILSKTFSDIIIQSANMPRLKSHAAYENYRKHKRKTRKSKFAKTCIYKS